MCCFTCFLTVRLVSLKHAKAWGWAGKEYSFHNWLLEVGRNSQPMKWAKDSNTPTEENSHHISKAGCNGGKMQTWCIATPSWLLWLDARLPRRGANVWLTHRETEQAYAGLMAWPKRYNTAGGGWQDLSQMMKTSSLTRDVFGGKYGPTGSAKQGVGTKKLCSLLSLVVDTTRGC